MNVILLIFTFVIQENSVMKERILEFLKKENKSSVRFAEEIGVQPSGISHILSGRNRPSLDFILRMLEKFPYLSTEWLLFGKGSMYKEHRIPTLFDDLEQSLSDNMDGSDRQSPGARDNIPVKPSDSEKTLEQSMSDINAGGLKRIIWFYNDSSFEEFYPRKE